jgi:hypothetical protein
MRQEFLMYLFRDKRHQSECASDAVPRIIDATVEIIHPLAPHLRLF